MVWTHTAQPAKVNTTLDTSYLDARQQTHYLIVQLAEPPLKHLAGHEYLKRTAHWANTAAGPTHSVLPRLSSVPPLGGLSWSPGAEGRLQCPGGRGDGADAGAEVGGSASHAELAQHSPVLPVWQLKFADTSPQTGSYVSFSGVWAWVMWWRAEFWS